MPQGTNRESYRFENEQGVFLDFEASELNLLVATTLGTAPIEYSTTRGIGQDGNTVQRFRLNNRSLNVAIFVDGHKFKTKAEYHAFRNDLHQLFNPLSRLTLTITRLDGSRRQLTNIYPSSGISFVDNEAENGGWNIRETVGLTAYTPYFVNPETVVYNVAPSINDELVFPIDFSIFFGNAGTSFTQSIDYDGSWISYPTITVTGPYNTCTITNVWNSSTINFFLPVGANQQRIITLNPAITTIVDQNGINRIGEITEESNLVDFYINPTQENVISVGLIGTDVTSSVQIDVQETFIGI